LRLFVGFELPASIGATLAALAPSHAPGVRVMRAGEMHVTLHFIGDGDAAAVRTALATVAAAPVELAVAGTGRFDQRGGRAILFAGVAVTDALLELHTAVGRALAVTGFVPERRRFRPHVTVARLKAAVDRKLVRAWLDAGRERAFGAFVAHRFVLFDSVTDAGGARYVALESYGLG